VTTRLMCLMLFSFACTESNVPADAGPLSDAATDFTDSSDDASASEPHDAGVDAPLTELEDTGPPLSPTEERARLDFVRHLSGRWRATGFDDAQVFASECQWTVDLELREDGTMSTHCVEVAAPCANRFHTPECLPVGLPGDRFEGRWQVHGRRHDESPRWQGSIETPARPAPWPAEFQLVEDGAILRFWLPFEMGREARGSYWLERW